PCFAGRFSQALTGRFQVVGESSLPKRVRRIVSLLSLAGRIDDRTVVARLTHELRGITGQQVLVVHFDPEHKAVILDDWPELDTHFSGAFAFQDHVTAIGQGIDELRLSVSSEARVASFVPPLLSHCGRHYDYVILRVAPAT